MSEIEVVGTIRKGTNGVALLAGNTGLPAEDSEKVNKMLGRISLLFMQEHAAADEPYVPRWPDLI